MIKIEIKTVDLTHRVAEAAERATFKNLSHAAATIRKDAIESIQPDDGPSEPGTPPNTQTNRVTKKGKFRRGHLPRSILFFVDKQKQEMVVGPSFGFVKEVGAVHEFGEEFHGVDYPERPFMEPALEKNVDRFGDSFASSIRD